ncbi:MAG TPA: CDP-glycerol glycerophosphotransferase family protein [Candidatus Saccharimonadales bacterium]|nr:CDP-glycerol glycerophosphotransferase family protein [Candidatus Saccharimonadales bacterium]
MSRLEYRLASVLLRVIGALSGLMPIKPQRVVLATARVATLEGNLAFLHAAMVARHPEREYVLLLEPYDYGLRGKLRYLLRLARGMYHLRTSGLFIVDNAYLPIHVAPHRPGTTVVQVWHAVAALKRFGADTLGGLDEVEDAFLHRHYDYVVCTAERSRGPWSTALRTPIERVLPLGTPRTDLFADQAALDATAARVRAAYPLMAGRRVILYAPTFRGRGVAKRAAGDLDAARLRAGLAPEDLLVLKTHPNLDPALTDTTGFDLVIDPATELNDLLTVTDILITDYSSSIFEYALLRRPLVLLVPDLATYEADPGMYLDFRTEMIGTQVTDTAGVLRVIAEGDFDLAAYEDFIDRHLGAADGRASERFVTRFLDEEAVGEGNSGTLPRDVRHE